MENENKNAGVTNNVNNNVSGTDAGTGQVAPPAATEKSDSSANVPAGSGQQTGNGADKADEGKQKQDSATNAEFARRRREQQKAEEKAKQELEFYKREIGVNPWTEQPIEDADDIKQYRLMKQIEKEGGDPLNDYAKYLKKERKAESKKNEEKSVSVSFGELSEEQKQARINEDISKFGEKYPDVAMSDVFDNKDFMDFAGELLGEVPLATLYGLYEKTSAYKEKKANEIEKKATQIANSQASVGSLASSGAGEDKDFFTKEQVEKMSPAEISKNYEKIRKSQEKW